MECRRVYFPLLFRYLWAAETWLLRMELVHLASPMNNFGKFMRSVRLMALSMSVFSKGQRTKSFLPCQHVNNC